MGAKKNRRDVDRLLADWAKGQATRDLSDLENRVIAACRREVSSAAESRSVPPRRSPWRRLAGATAWLAAGIAAVLLALACLRWGDGLDRPTDEPTALAGRIGKIDPDLVRKKTDLLKGLEEVFGPRVRWIAETGSSVRLGIREDEPETDLQALGKPFLVRLVIASRAAGNQDWQPQWTADLVVRESDVVRLTPQSAGLPPGTHYALWTYEVDDGLIAVESQLGCADGVVDAAYDGVQRTGVPVALDAHRRNQDEYRVFQTIAPLAEGA